MSVDTDTQLAELAAHKTALETRWNVFQEEIDAQLAELHAESQALVRTKRRRFEKANQAIVVVNQRLAQVAKEAAEGTPAKQNDGNDPDADTPEEVTKPKKLKRKKL